MNVETLEKGMKITVLVTHGILGFFDFFWLDILVAQESEDINVFFWFFFSHNMQHHASKQNNDAGGSQVKHVHVIYKETGGSVEPRVRDKSYRQGLAGNI